MATPKKDAATEESQRGEAVDMLTLVLCLPFCMWLGWWGILPAFGIGFAINVCCAAKKKGGAA